MKKRMMSLISLALVGAMILPHAVIADEAAEEGKVLNIQCWNEEFKSRMTDHYPGYEEVDATHGKIGDVDVVWTITPSDDNAYQNQLDSVLPGNEEAAADDQRAQGRREPDDSLSRHEQDCGGARLQRLLHLHRARYRFRYAV